jgi:hypothetical protein
MISRRKHALLKKVCKNWNDYMKGKMGIDTFGNDCSCGCKFFIELQDSGDWGVCNNSESPRAGFLTWEHFGCPKFQRGR